MVYCYSFFQNSLIIHDIIYQKIVYGFFDFFLLFNAIKIHMKTVSKINNLIKENILPLKVSSLKWDGWYQYLRITNYVKTHISGTKPVSIWLATLAHILNGYEKCFKITNYPFFNMQDFRNVHYYSNLACFS